MSKKAALTVVFVFTALSIGGYLIKSSRAGFPTDETADSSTFQTQKIIENVFAPKKNTKCTISDSFDYYYYGDVSPDDMRNNKFGLYIYAENRDFFELADELINSNGGDWGYVLIPYNIKDRDRSKWNDVFEELNKRHLIPIIQLWDIDPGKYETNTRQAAAFLNSFLWPIKERYISVYNETNAAEFWRGNVDPGGYAEVLDFTINTFKDQNPNFYMLNGAFNVSAPSNGDYMDSFEYMRLMNERSPGIFDKLDGWASHSYPQPNFSGNPYATGRWSVKAYDIELSFLRDVLGVSKDLPVFITETGWAHAEGEALNSSFLSDEDVGKNLQIAFEEIWLNDNRVVAVTPFTVRYDPPFDHFSWVNKDNVPYFHYDVVKSIKKIAGNPRKLIKKTVEKKTCLEN